MSHTNGNGSKKPSCEISPGIRYFVLQRDGFRCRYCGARAGDVELHIDHVVAIANGGTNDPENLASVCRTCNGGKGASALTIAASRVEPGSLQSPLVGLFCFKTSTDPEMTRFGWNWNYQARVHSVIGDVAMLQFYDALMGIPGDIKPVPFPELLSGEWIFYRTEEAFRECGQEAMDRYYLCAKREHWVPWRGVVTSL